METYNEILSNLESLKNVAEDIICEEEVTFSLTIPFSEAKARKNAKYFDFHWNSDKKTWEKKSNRCPWQLTSYITNIFKI